MMKRKITGRLIAIMQALILSGLLWCIPQTVAHAGTTAEGLVYDDSYGNVSITGYTGGGGPVVIPETINGEEVVMIDHRAFFASGITSISLPTGLVSIGSYAFGECSSLASVTIPDTVTVIGMRAFEDCTSLATIQFGKALATMGDAIFIGCSSLTNIVLPPLLGDIPEDAFRGCKNIVNLTIPAGVRSIGATAFYISDSLKNVYFLGDAPSIGHVAFSPDDNNGHFNRFVMHYYPHSTGFTTPTWVINSYTTYLTSYMGYSGVIISPVTIARTGSTTAVVTFTADKAGWAYAEETDIGAAPPAIPCSGLGWGVEPGPNAMNVNDLSPNAQVLYIRVKDTDGNASPMIAYNLPAYVPATYTVSFNSQGGSPVAAKTATEGTTITPPVAPTRAGYGFAGWFKEAACTHAWNFAADTVTSNKTLYAKWLAVYTITFNSQGGSPVASKTALAGSTITAPVKPTRAGYNFDDWFKNKECGMDMLWDFWNDKVMTNTTLYAHWIAATSYTIKVSSSNTAYGTVTGGGTYGNEWGADVKATPKAGCRFVRWLEGTAPVSTSFEYKFSVTRNRTLKAEFAKIGVPAITVASAGYDRILISWAAVPGASGYEIYRATSAAGAYAKVTTATALSYTNTGLSTGMPYFYKVRAKCTAGPVITFGVYSPYKSGIPVPGAPTNVKAAAATSSSIDITWNTVAGATQYEVWRSQSAAGAYTLVTTAAATSFTNIGLTKGQPYYYKVRAYRLAGTKKVYGPYSTAVHATP